MRLGLKNIFGLKSGFWQNIKWATCQSAFNDYYMNLMISNINHNHTSSSSPTWYRCDTISVYLPKSVLERVIIPARSWDHTAIGQISNHDCTLYLLQLVSRDTKVTNTWQSSNSVCTSSSFSVSNCRSEFCMIHNKAQSGMTSWFCVPICLPRRPHYLPLGVYTKWA